MAHISVKTAVGFKGQTVAQVYVPEGIDECWVNDKLKTLNELGLTAVPGVREAHNQKVIRIYGKDPKTNPNYGEAELKADISKVLQGEEVTFSGLFDEPAITPPASNFGKWLQKNAPWAYERAGAITGSLLFAGAGALMQSAFSTGGAAKADEDGSPQKRKINVIGALSAICFMLSSTVIGLFVRQPKNPRHVYQVFDDLQKEVANKPAENFATEAASKDDFLTSFKENMRRFPWEISSLINVPANTLLTLSTMTKGSREKSDMWWTKSLVGLTMMGTHLIRILTPQNGGKTLLSKFPATRGIAEKLGLENIDSNSELSKNPINFTSNLSLGAKAAGLVAGKLTGDGGFAWSQPLEFAGVMFAKATSKAVGLGFDETITTGADFISKWEDAAISADDKIKWVAKKLSRQPEIFHAPEDLEAGIRERLKQFEALKNATVESKPVTVSKEIVPEKLLLEPEKSGPKKKGCGTHEAIANEAMILPQVVSANVR